MTQETHFYYDQQIKKYIVQFMAIFGSFKVKIGKDDTNDEQLISVPIHFGNKDRVVASIISKNTQNTPIRLPVMSANFVSIGREFITGRGVELTDTFLPIGGIFPDDIQTITTLKQPQLKMEMEVSLYTSNIEQRLQFLEQLYLIFNPSVEIQVSTNPFNYGKLCTVELEDLPTFEDNYPSGMDRRVVITTFRFKLSPVYIVSPAIVRNNYIKDIKIRVGSFSASEDFSQGLEKLNSDGVQYQTTSFNVELPEYEGEN